MSERISGSNVESQFKDLLLKLDGLCKESKYSPNVRRLPILTFKDNDEIFGLDYLKSSYNSGTYEIELFIEKYQIAKWNNQEHRMSFHPPLREPLLYQNPQEDCYLYDSSTEIKLSSSPAEIISDVSDLLQFMIDEFKDEPENKTITNIPNFLKSIINRFRQSEPMQFEYARDEFFEKIKPIAAKVKPVKGIKDQYKTHGSVLRGTTGWVDVKKDGKEIQLSYDRTDNYMNGDWTLCGEIRIRQKGDEGRGRALFMDLDIRRDMPSVYIHNSRDVKDAVTTLELLNQVLNK